MKKMRTVKNQITVIVALTIALIASTTKVKSETNWIEASSDAAWNKRAYHQALVYKNQMWMIGGQYGRYTTKANDVWSSTDGVNWTEITSNAKWIPRSAMQALVYNNKMWVLGGSDGAGNKLNDVWFSTNGEIWNKATSTAKWQGRAGHQALVFNDYMWVLGGSVEISPGNSVPTNDVWFSSDGIHWTLATDNAGWSERDLHEAVVYDGKMWVLGGLIDWNPEQATLANDVWFSSNGIHWTCATPSTEWTKRDSHQAFVYDNTMWVIGGFNSSSKVTNDIWYSINGSNWINSTSEAQWPERGGFQALIYENHIWILGGTLGPPSWELNDVWLGREEGIQYSGGRPETGLKSF